MIAMTDREDALREKHPQLCLYVRLIAHKKPYSDWTYFSLWRGLGHELAQLPASERNAESCTQLRDGTRKGTQLTSPFRRVPIPRGCRESLGRSFHQQIGPTWEPRRNFTRDKARGQSQS